MAEAPGLAVVIGGSGGIGAAFVEQLGRAGRVISLHRRGTPPLDLMDEAGIAAAAAHVGAIGAPRLIIVATGFLHGGGLMPEKSLAALNPAHLAHSHAINAIGPALLMKHFLPLLPRAEPAAFVCLSARVGSIGDNGTGGWYGYRASKAALNQLLRTAAIETARKKPLAVCVAIHPGTVDSPLSAPFPKTGLKVRDPATAAAEMLAVISRLTPAQNGGFFDYTGAPVPW